MALSTMVPPASAHVDRKQVLLPEQNNLLKNPLGNPPPLVVNNTIRLAAWKISGRDYLCQGFLQRLQNLSPNLEGIHLQAIMNRPGESGLAGVEMNKLIQFHVM